MASHRSKSKRRKIHFCPANYNVTIRKKDPQKKTLQRVSFTKGPVSKFLEHMIVSGAGSASGRSFQMIEGLSWFYFEYTIFGKILLGNLSRAIC